jgi:hypothetical protein
LAHETGHAADLFLVLVPTSVETSLVLLLLLFLFLSIHPATDDHQETHQTSTSSFVSRDEYQRKA